MRNLLITGLMMASCSATGADQPFNPYNQQYTFNQNQQYGSTNWYSSALGMGVAQAGVTLIGGLVNAMSRPDPVVYLPPPSQPVYVNGSPSSIAPTGSNSLSGNNCTMQTMYDQGGSPRYLKVCE
jgi:hypothetical protein